jgi:hypothetical protein
MSYLNVDGAEKHKPVNHFNYSEADLAEKTLALHNLKIMYPTVSPYHAELIYDMCKNCSQEEIEALKVKADAPFKYNYTGLQEILNEKFKPMEPMTIGGSEKRPDGSIDI